MATVKEIMSEIVATIEADRSVTEACVEMAYKDIGALVVVEKGSVVGIFTERDLLKKAVYQGLDLQTEKIGKVMSRPAICVKPDDKVESITDKMLLKNFRHLPVVKNGKLLGMVSVKDLLRYFMKETKQAKEKS